MLSERYAQALAALQDHARVVAALGGGDTEAPEEGEVERLRGEMIDAQARMGHYHIECGRIMQITLDSDDPALSLSELTPERLSELLGA